MFGNLIPTFWTNLSRGAKAVISFWTSVVVIILASIFIPVFFIFLMINTLIVWLVIVLSKAIYKAQNDK